MNIFVMRSMDIQRNLHKSMNICVIPIDLYGFPFEARSRVCAFDSKFGNVAHS